MTTKKGNKQFNIWIDPVLHKRLAKKAKQEDRTMGAVARLAIREYLEKGGKA